MEDRKIINKGTIKEILKELNKQFYQVHRSYIVNFKHIYSREKNELIMTDGQRINISKDRIKDFDEKYDIYENASM